MLNCVARFVRERLRDETGMALVMAVGVSAVIAIMGGSLVLYSTSNEKIANRSKGDLRAYQLAQSGIDAAASIIAAQPLDGGRQNATVVGTLLPATRTFGSGESVVYDAALYDDTPVSVVGTPIVRPWRWVLTATATVPNPNAGGPGVSRTLSATMLLSPRAPATTVESQAWKYIYSKLSDDGSMATCEVILDNNSDFNTSFYASGTLCMRNQGDINSNPSGPLVEVIAKGGLWIDNSNAWVGKTAADSVALVETPVNGCKFRSNPAGPCTATQHVNATTVVAPSATTVPGPDIDFATIADVANPGPRNLCQTRSGSYPDFAAMTIGSTFDLTGATYTCKNAAGELSFDATTRLLTVRGLIYFPGSLVANGNVAVRYQGIGAIYVAGSYNQRQTALCAAVSGSSCNWTGWDTTNNVLLIGAAGGNGAIGSTSCVNPYGGATSIVLEQNTQFQGALYADGNTNICYQNLSSFQGPSVAYSQIFDNQVDYKPMPDTGIVNVPFGTPGQVTPVSAYDVTPPINYTG